MGRKFWLLTVLSLLSLTWSGHAQPLAQKPKRIYVTLDVSGSMEGNKYVMADYAAQALAVFSAPEDIVTVYYLGQPHRISGETGYKTLQIPYNRHKGQNSYHEISDLTRFVGEYKPDSRYQDWLFIIGDGYWDWGKAKPEYERTTRQLSDLIAKESLRVCYLQTGNKLTETYAFTTFLEDRKSSLVDIRKSDTTAVSVLDNCIYFANRILGFSSTGIRCEQSAASDASFTSEFPLEKCLLVYQSGKTGAGEVRISSVSCEDRTVSYRVKGNPSTKPLIISKEKVLNGIIWELDCPETIPANRKVSVHFEKDIDVKDLTLYPYVDVQLRMQPLSVALDPLPEARPGYFKISDTDSRVLVKISATDKFGNKFPPPLMQRMDVKFSVGGDERAAAYCATDTTFQILLDMPQDTVSYFSTVESPGYFSRMSSRQTVVKSADMRPPEHVPMITLSELRLPPVRFHSLKNGERFGGRIEDPLLSGFPPLSAFGDQTVTDRTGYDHTAPLEFSLDADGNVSFTHIPNSTWCECTFPDTLHYTITLRSAEGVLHDRKIYEGFTVPVSVPVEKGSWWGRCRNHVILGAGLFLFILYLLLLLKKKRFGKDAAIIPTYYNYYGKLIEQGGYQLRQPGLGAWFTRWFIPGRETATLGFTAPNVPSLALTAGDSAATLRVRKSSIVPATMSIKGYRPKDDTDKSPFITLQDNDRIQVRKVNGTQDGYLTFTKGQGRDGRGYRFFLILILLASLAAEALVCLTLLQSFGLLT